MFNFSGLFEKVTDVGSGILEATFNIIEDSFRFNAGQYVWIVLSKLNFPDERGERRAFSISSSSYNNKQISILYRDSESGYKKSLKSLTKGARVQIIGPFGASYIPKPSQQKITLIAGGVGISPFLSILRSIKDEDKDRFTLITFNSTHDQLPYSNELKSISKNKGVNMVQHMGHFTGDMLPNSIDYENEFFYICGSKGFVDVVYKSLESRKVKMNHMVFEQYYPTLSDNLTVDDFNFEKEKNNILLQAIHDSKNHVIITDINGQIIFANKTAENITGYSFKEMVGNTPRLWGGLMTPEFYENFWHQKHEEGGFDGRLLNRRKSGEVYHVISHISPIKNTSGVVVGYIGTEEDVTVLFNMESQLKMEQKRDEALLLSIGDGVVAQGKDGKVMFVNQSALNMLGYSSDELKGQSFAKIVRAVSDDEKLFEEYERPLVKAMKIKERIKTSLTYLRKDNTKLEVNVIITPIFIDDEYFGCVEVFNDITLEKQIDKAKTEFISLASHQLRTPLSTINWYCEMLLAGDAGQISNEQRKFVEEAYGGSKRMSKLVNALLNVSRIETGSFMVEPEKVDVVKIARSVLDESKPKIDERLLSVKLEKEAIPEIMLDPNLTTMIFQNLITNSVKYSKTSGIIHILLKIMKAGESIGQISVENDSLLIQITDNGMGIPTDQQTSIFKKLFRADNARKSDTEGSGLGLYLIKSLIEHSKGKIWFYSEEGKGTVFYVLLPLSGMIKKEGTKKLNQ